MHFPRARKVPLGTRTLLRDWLRLVISIGGIGFAILLVLLLDGIRTGTVAKSTTYIDHVGADIIVARQGVTNMALAASVLPDDVVARVAAVEGVRTTSGIMRIPVIVEANDKKRPVTLIGYDPAAALGGAWKLGSGRNVQQNGEAVVDRTLAGELGLHMGGSLTISGAAFKIVGLSDETANIAGKLVFVTLTSMQEALGLGNIVTFVLVQTQPHVSVERVRQQINQQLPDVTATPRDVLSRNDRSLIGSLFVAPINVMATVGFLVGLAIIGLTMYTTTAERLRDFGVLKAIGARNTYLLRTVVTQATILGLLGFAAGLGASYVAGPFIVHLVPDIGVTIRAASALATLAAVLAMSLLGAVVPIVRIMRVDPLVVFRS